MRNIKTYNRRNKLIYEYYCTRWGDGIRDKIIIGELHDQFHLEHKTLEDIVRMMRRKSQEEPEKEPAQQQLQFDRKEDENGTDKV
jgi:hypothetical protein